MLHENFIQELNSVFIIGATSRSGCGGHDERYLFQFFHMYLVKGDEIVRPSAPHSDETVDRWKHVIKYKHTKKWMIEFLRKFESRFIKIAQLNSIITKFIDLLKFCSVYGVRCDRGRFAVHSPFIEKSMIIDIHHSSIRGVKRSLLSYFITRIYPDRQGGCLVCCGCTFDSRWGCTDLYYARGAHGVLPMRVGGATSQLDQPSLTPLSVAGCGWLQLRVPNWATSVDYCK